MQQGFRAFYVPLIFIIPWLGVPGGFYFAKIKPLNEEFASELEQRNSARAAYGSSQDVVVMWPAPGQEELEEFQPGVEDKKNDAVAFENTRQRKEEEYEETVDERNQHMLEYNRTRNRFMAGFARELDPDVERFKQTFDRPLTREELPYIYKLDYENPDLVFEILKRQRDQAGPHLIEFLHRQYGRPGSMLFFQFSHQIDAPPLNLPPIDAGNLPETGPQGRLAWPIGHGAMQMTVYGPYDKLLDFVETFGEKYDRITLLTDFSLSRVAFDYTGAVLMRLNITAQFFVWPEHPEAGASAAGGGGFAEFGMSEAGMIEGSMMEGSMPPGDMSSAPPAGDMGGMPPAGDMSGPPPQ